MDDDDDGCRPEGFAVKVGGGGVTPTLPCAGGCALDQFLH